jgi:short-subunit dehydrogenase
VVQVAVVVGASSGLGRAVALQFAAEGASVVLAARSRAELDVVAEECRARGAAVVVAPLDVADAAAVDALAVQAVETFGHVDVWVHLAAVAVFAPFDEVPAADFARVIDVNVMGYVHGARAALSVFRAQGRGVLVNVASIVAVVPAPALASYVTSKFAVLGLGKALRADLRDLPDVHVCTLMPGAMGTPMWGNAGNSSRRQPKPPAPLYPVERVARAVVRCARHPRPEVTVGGAVKTLHVAHRVAPRLVERALVPYLAWAMYRTRPAVFSKVAQRFRSARRG